MPPQKNPHHIHISHYFILLLLLILGTFFILFFHTDSRLQIITTITMATSYFLWGVIHHLKRKDLHSSVLLEYLFIAIFGALILISIIQRS